MPKTEPRAEWAAAICAAHERAVESVLEVGRTLIAANKILGKHGEWEKLIENDLPFEASTNQRLWRLRVILKSRKLRVRSFAGSLDDTLRASQATA